MTREVLKMALEKLETMNHHDSIFSGEFDEEVAAIKEALTQPESINIENFVVMDMFSHTRELDSLRNTIQALSEANEAWSTKVKSLEKSQAQPDQFTPDYDTEAVLVEEMQRMAKRIEDLEAMLERQPLPLEQIDSLWQTTDTGDFELDIREFARAIELHHGIGEKT